MRKKKQKPVKLHDSVMEMLARRIISGVYPAETTLPNETELCEQLSVGRSSLREAVRVLTDKGMLVVQRRIGTRVTPSSQWNRLDGDLIRWTAHAAPDQQFMWSLLEARRIFEPAAAELAATRATAADLARIEAGYMGMVGSWKGGDAENLVEADIAFHRAILDSTKNVVLMQMVSIIEAALRAGFRHTTNTSRTPEVALDAHFQVLEAIRLRNPEQARSRMTVLMDWTAKDLESSLLNGKRQ
ncbi:FadR/GntR family transcriptional regulator [Bradyrhizobium sp. CCBAU 53338]|uniref:FadR/GntR family transcriptional regulator n=1 Tax=Bradyrhizobium sp. CCBAU 53338 TaxID=1325111 RepID=UPI00188D6585|nr:FadR/GntR family transcriptional regulator [Bradyrhizobium sp. CCBAU 53338]QOZ52485.1 FadR family transcriptional regulator [Bradyrhizobium sp. CCBAU 53338]